MKIKLDTKKIYLAMAEKGLTATEIAQAGGVSRQPVSNAFKGAEGRGNRPRPPKFKEYLRKRNLPIW